MGGEFSDGGEEISDAARDLFGMPVLPSRERGRPGHTPTAETRQFVNLLFVCGHPWLAIAKALGLKKTAFYEHYAAEIRERQFAALKFKGRQLQRLNDAAEKGNVAAEKALAGMVQAEQIRTLNGKVAERGKPAEPQPKLGKKEEEREAAHGVTGRFEPRPPPPLLLN